MHEHVNHDARVLVILAVDLDSLYGSFKRVQMAN